MVNDFVTLYLICAAVRDVRIKRSHSLFQASCSNICGGEVGPVRLHNGNCHITTLAVDQIADGVLAERMGDLSASGLRYGRNQTPSPFERIRWHAQPPSPVAGAMNRALSPGETFSPVCVNGQNPIRFYLL